MKMQSASAAPWTPPYAVILFWTVAAIRATMCLGEAPGNARLDRENLDDVLRAAIRAESELELTLASRFYNEVVRQGSHSGSSELWIAAQQGLRRVASLRTGFAWTQADLDRALAKTFSDYRSEELSQWESRGWLHARSVDGQKRYHVSSATNLAYFDTALRRRNPRLAEGDRLFARVFLDTAAELDARRCAAGPRRPYVSPQAYLYTVKAVIRQADLPSGQKVRAWIPAPLNTPAVQNIRISEVRPEGALVLGPDVQATLGLVYLEVPRPEKGDLTLSISIAFDAYHTDLAVDPERIPPYDEQSEVFRRYTRSEPANCDQPRDARVGEIDRGRGKEPLSQSQATL